MRRIDHHHQHHPGGSPTIRRGGGVDTGVLGAAPVVWAIVASILTACGPDPAPRGTGSRNAAAGGDSLLAVDDQVLDSSAAVMAPAPQGRWSVLLRTFSGDGHEERADEFVIEVTRRYPVFGEVFVEPRRGGSMVVAGRFFETDDPEAQEALGLAKGITVGGGRPFAAAMLVRRTTAADASPPKPYDLRTLRARYPGRTELYTLQIGLWSTFGTREIEPEDVRRRAELEVAKLRAQGFEAWFHHDPDSEMSTVTVGSFGADAYDPRSTLYAPEVERLMRAFPKHFINGEEVLVPSDQRRSGELRPQGPRLVEVPFD